MSATRSFCLSLRFILGVGAASCFLTPWETVRPQAVPSQANIDASAQRRLQETAREAQRQRRIEEQIRILAPALDSEKLAGSGGPLLARKALAALARLQGEGVPPEDALSRAVRSAKLDASRSAKPSSYLRNLAAEMSSLLTSDLLEKLEAGEDPAPKLSLPPYRP